MPELPEVQTTVTILNKIICNKTIVNVWNGYNAIKYKDKQNIKNKTYFIFFKKQIIGRKITSVSRRAKHILIELDDQQTILVHMKMTGHLLYGKYFYNKNEWITNEPGPLQDSFNKFIHFVITFSDGTHLVLSDMRKFATIYLLENKKMVQEKLKTLGPEPLEKIFDKNILKNALLKKPNSKIKTALMNQNLLSGIGNIYSDEILWASRIRPERTVLSLTNFNYTCLIKNIKEILLKGIDFGGDSLSDYRNPYGQRGEFQLHHNAYRRTHQKCKRKGCAGIIERKILNGRSAHFCPQCQK